MPPHHAQAGKPCSSVPVVTAQWCAGVAVLLWSLRGTLQQGREMTEQELWYSADLWVVWRKWAGSAKSCPEETLPPVQKLGGGGNTWKVAIGRFRKAQELFLYPTPRLIVELAAGHWNLIWSVKGSWINEWRKISIKSTEIQWQHLWLISQRKLYMMLALNLDSEVTKPYNRLKRLMPE